MHPQDSWQYEIHSSAEYTPPLSPAPPSPTLYSFSLSPVNNVNKGIDFLDVKSSSLTPIQNEIEIIGYPQLDEGEDTEELLTLTTMPPLSPFIKGSGGESFLAENMLVSSISVMSSNYAEVVSMIPPGRLPVVDQLPKFVLPHIEDLEWKEEKSYNLGEIFEDIGNLDCSQGVLDDQFQPESPLGKPELKVDIRSLPPFTVKTESTSNDATEQSDSNNVELQDCFQEIIEELGLNVDIANIETIPGIVYVDELNELVNEGEDLGLISRDDSMMEMESEDDQLDGDNSIGNQSPDSSFGEVVIVSDDSQSDLKLFMNDSMMSTTSSLIYMSQASSTCSSDDEDDAQEMIIDALGRGDMVTAESVLNSSRLGRQSRGGRNAEAKAVDDGTRASTSLYSEKLAMLKPEKRGRKPSSAGAGKSWANLTDKSLRKKEQNKTAATRYRQKKKMQTLYSLEKEQELAKISEKLCEQRDELAKEIRVTKSILRLLFSAKKGKKSIANRR